MSRIQSINVLRSTILVASLLMVVIVGGCTPYSTYPPVAQAEVQVPWMYPMPQVMAKALQTTFDKTAPPLEAESGRPMLVYALPEGISQRVWRQVGIDTGSEGAREWNEADLDAEYELEDGSDDGSSDGSDDDDSDSSSEDGE